jgi:DNA-binding NtrC family response regulator
VALSPRLRDFLLSYSYPGNIRELRNIMYRLACLAGDVADLAQLPEDIRQIAAVPAPASASASASEKAAPDGVPAAAAMPPASLAEAKRLASDEAERACLERGLKDVGGTVAELARRWDMNRSHLQILLKKHGLHSKDFRQRAP